MAASAELSGLWVELATNKLRRRSCFDVKDRGSWGVGGGRGAVTAPVAPDGFDLGGVCAPRGRNRVGEGGGPGGGRGRMGWWGGGGIGASVRKSWWP